MMVQAIEGRGGAKLYLLRAPSHWSEDICDRIFDLWTAQMFPDTVRFERLLSNDEYAPMMYREIPASVGPMPPVCPDPLAAGVAVLA